MYDGIRARYLSEFLARGTPPGFGDADAAATGGVMPSGDAAVSPAQACGGRRLRGVRRGGRTEATATCSRAFLRQVCSDCSRPLQVDSKYEAMERRLLGLRDRGMRQVMVFSFFRGTLEYLHERLSLRMSVRLMTGATPMDERQQVMEDFRDGQVRRSPAEPGRCGGARLRVLQRDGQLRPAVEPDAGRAAHRTPRPLRPDSTNASSSSTCTCRAPSSPTSSSGSTSGSGCSRSRSVSWSRSCATSSRTSPAPC